MTLNSIDWKEKILIRNKSTKENLTIEIGKFIDDLLENNKKDVKKMGDNKKDEMGDVHYLDIKDKEVYIPSVDENGKVSWKLIEAVTKHLPINKDGTDTLIHVKTRLGKEVTATKGKSFLTRKNNKIVPTRGDNIKVGDCLPVTKTFPLTEIDTHLDLVKYFPKNEYTYGSELIKAKKFKEQCEKEGIRNWYVIGTREKKFEVCQSHSSLSRYFKGERNKEYLEGYIYPKQCQNTKSLVPEKLPLDKSFGFIVGAYLAEGWWCDDVIGIANNDIKYRNLVKDFADKYNIKYDVIERHGDHLTSNTSYSIRLHSILLATLLLNTCGKSAGNKRIPDFAFTANDEFMSGLLNGYFSGDGHVTTGNTCKIIGCTSISKELIIGISTLLTKFGIVSKVSTRAPRKECYLPSTNVEDLKQQYTLTIRNDNIKLFSEKVNLVIDYKNDNLEELCDNEYKMGCGTFDKIPGTNLESLKLIENVLNKNKTKTTDYSNGIIHMEDIKYLYDNYKDEISKEELKIIKNIIDSNVYYDEIISITEIKPTNKYVYDFTVKDTQNFSTFSSLQLRDSFHHSGIATLSAQVNGFPRAKELMGVSKKPKAPTMLIYFTPDLAGSKDMAHKIASHIKHTTLGEVRGNIQVYYDPNPNAKGSIMEKDNIKQVFQHHKGTRTGCQQDINGLPWLLRIELNREKMLEKEVNVLEINSKFCSWWEKRFGDNKLMKKEEKKVISKITQLAVLSNTDNDKQPVVHIRFNAKDADKDKFDLGTIKNFMEYIIDPFKLKGITGVTDIPAIQQENTIYFNKDTGALERKQEYVVYTTGVNMMDIRYLTGVDLNRTVTNHVVEMYDKFGIEIARSVLLREFANAYERAGGEVNYQHVSMIVDQMTATGQINSIDRHGMNKSDSDPLSRASFEKTVEQLLIAAVYGETDQMRGVSSRIMAGAVIKGGTGYCDLELDTEMIEKSEYLEGTDYTKKFVEINKGTIAEDIIKKKGHKGTFVPM